MRPQMRGQSFILQQVERKKWIEFLIRRRFLVENLPFFEEMEEFIGKSFLFFVSIFTPAIHTKIKYNCTICFQDEETYW